MPLNTAVFELLVKRHLGHRKEANISAIWKNKGSKSDPSSTNFSTRPPTSFSKNDGEGGCKTTHKISQQQRYYSSPAIWISGKVKL